MQRPDPRDGAERQLEHARPVDACEWRIRREPAFEFPGNGCRVTIVAGQPRGSTELQPMLMTIQLPDDLMVAEPRVEIGHARPELEGRTTPEHRVEMPVELRAV